MFLNNYWTFLFIFLILFVFKGRLYWFDKIVCETKSPEAAPGMLVCKQEAGRTAGTRQGRQTGTRIIDTMSRELQDKAERIMRELRESLVPIKEEINRMRKNTEEKNTRTLK